MKKFKCPKCGSSNLISAESGIVNYPVSLSSKDKDDKGILIDYTKPDVIDTEADHFGCADCNFILNDNEGMIDSIDNLVVWLEEHGETIIEQYEWYILKMVGCVDPVLVGPLPDEKTTEIRYLSLVDDAREDENAHTLLKVSQGSKIAIV